MKNYELDQSSYGPIQRTLCVTLAVAGTLSVSNIRVLANSPAPFINAGPVPVLHNMSHMPPHLSHNNFLPPSFSTRQALLNSKSSSSLNSSSQASAGNSLNLTSGALSFLSNNISNFRDMVIQVGGTKEVVTLGTRLTAAEVVAAEQVLTSGTQSIKLSGSGTADGGTIILNSALLNGIDSSTGGSIGALTIAHGVKLIDDVNTLSVGSISNYGSILTASGHSGGTDVISAGTITNDAGGKIGSYSATGVGSNGLFAADSSLIASASLTNSGSISSAGNVNIATQSLYNSGSISAGAGNVNVTSPGALAVNGSGGTIQATNGNINLSSHDSSLALSGGNYISQNLNLKSGTGDLTANVDKVSGLVNANGTNVFIAASKTGDLRLGNIDSSGDPLIADTGNITIDGSITATSGNPLTLIASGNIVSGSGNVGLNTSSATGNGGNLTLIAGANFTTGSGTVTVTQSTNAGHGSSTGGYIDLTGAGSNPISTVTTGSSDGNAGNVQLISFAGSEKGSGAITLPTTVGINAASTSGGKNGNVLIVAGAASGTGVVIGYSTSSELAFNANNVNIYTSTPTVSSGGAVFNASSGAQTSGTISNSAAATAAGITVGGNAETTGTFTAVSGGAFTNEGYQIWAIGPASAPTALQGNVGQNVTITAGSILVGNIWAYGGGGTGSGNPSSGLAGGSGGNGGNVALTATTGSIEGFGNINVSGGGGGGGAGGSETAAATAGGSGGLAGTVTLNAATTVTLSDAVSILAYNGGAGGAGGAVAGGVGGGGGGGSAVGGGGGGGGGGVGNVATDFGAGGGGGFGGTAVNSTGTGGGGGGSFGNPSQSKATPTTGGGGGSFFGYGIGGSGNYYGYGGSYSSGGQGASSPGVNGGAGASSLAVGGGGGASSTSAQGTGASGAAPAVGGAVMINAGGTIGGDIASPTKADLPINIEVASLSINSTSTPSASASANIMSTSGVALAVTSARLGASGTFALENGPSSIMPANKGGAINITGEVTAGTATITTVGTSGPNNITVTTDLLGDGVGTVHLVSGTGGSIIATAGLINSLSATLSSAVAIDVDTNVSSLTAVAAGGSVVIDQGKGTLTLGASSAATGSTFSLTDGSAFNITNKITASGGITISDTGAITDSGKALLTGATVTLISSAGTGTSSLPILTTASTVNSQTSASGNLSVSDSGTGTVTVDAKTASSGTLTLSAAAAQLDLVAAPYAVVNITDSNASGNVLLNSGNSKTAVFGGSGSFTVSTAGNITTAANTTGIDGSSVSLKTTSGNIGSSSVSFIASSPSLTLSTGASGNAYVTDRNTKATGSDTLQNCSVGSLVLTDTNTSATNTGTLKVGNIAASTGQIEVATNEKTLSVAASSTITTEQGNITLLDTYAANGANLPLITIGQGTLIHASASGGSGLGNVFIALGAVPPLSTLKAGVAPTGGNPTIAGTVFFGTTAYPNGSISTMSGDVLTGSGSDLSFTTGSQGASQISLQSNVTIIADPPVAAASTPIIGVSAYSSIGSTQPIAVTSTFFSTGSINGTSQSILSVQTSSALSNNPVLTANSANTTSSINLAAVSDSLVSGLGATLFNVAMNNQNSQSGILPNFQSVGLTADQSHNTSISNTRLLAAKTLTGSASNVSHQTLDEGVLLFNADENTVVDTPYGSVSIAGGSVALLVAFDHGLAVYDLHDGHKGAVTIASGKQMTILTPGRTAVLSEQTNKTFEQVNPTKFVAYRRLTSRAVEGEAKLYQADFDILSMMSGLRPLREMVKSDSPKTRKVMANILKTAAILSTLGQCSDAFSLYIAPELTSCVPPTIR